MLKKLLPLIFAGAALTLAGQAMAGELIAGMLPAGVVVQRGAMGREFVLRVTAPGVYGVKCAPHYSMGMVGLIQVGTGDPNLEAVRTASARTPNVARRPFTQFFTQLR